MTTIEKFSFLSNFEFKLDEEEGKINEVSQIVPQRCFTSENNFTQLYLNICFDKRGESYEGEFCEETSILI